MELSELVGTTPAVETPQVELVPGQWYAVYTRSNYEKKVASQFELKGITSYLPVWEEVHNWSDRRKVVEVPVFRGYVFARFVDSGITRLSIVQTPGVARIVSGCGGIEAIPDTEIVAVERLLNSKAKCSLHPFLREGDWVRVVRGPLQGLEGYYLRHKSSTRLVISVSLISQAVATEIDSRDVQVADRTKAPAAPISPSQDLLASQIAPAGQPAA